MLPLAISSFPRAILHIDGDAFFASCEQALHPELKGRPVITGKERGIASAVSYEAKKLGIKRGMSIRAIKALCPEIIYLPSDYETYSLFSKRMYSIVRRYTYVLEEYGIDECFADITGLRRPLRMSYEKIAYNIKHDLEGELGITFSVGLSVNKVISKIGSKWNKPSGLTIIPANKIHLYLKNMPPDKIWGIGNQTAYYLNNLGVKTSLEFALKSDEWVKNNLSKPYYEIWKELNGEFVYSLVTGNKNDYQQISKTKTFTPASEDRNYVFAQLSKNIENACIKARRHGLSASEIFFYLRTNEYRHFGFGFKLSMPTSSPNEIISFIDKHFDSVFKNGEKYRCTGVFLSKLAEIKIGQMDLFGESECARKVISIYKSVDKMSHKFGKHIVFLGSSFKAMKGVGHLSQRADKAIRKKNLFKGETERKRLDIPMLGDVV